MGKTIFISSHILSELRIGFCDISVTILDRGAGAALRIRSLHATVMRPALTTRRARKKQLADIDPAPRTPPYLLIRPRRRLPCAFRVHFGEQMGGGRRRRSLSKPRRNTFNTRRQSTASCSAKVLGPPRWWMPSSTVLTGRTRAFRKPACHRDLGGSDGRRTICPISK